MSKLGKARQLSLDDWRVLGTASALLFAAEAGLRVFPFRKFRSWLTRSAPAPARPTGNNHHDAERIAYLVQVAAHYSPSKPTCLRTSAVLYRLLRKRGIDARLVIGTTQPGNSFAAHAWVESGGRVLGGGGPETYQPLLTIGTSETSPL